MQSGMQKERTDIKNEMCNQPLLASKAEIWRRNCYIAVNCTTILQSRCCGRNCISFKPFLTDRFDSREKQIAHYFDRERVLRRALLQRELCLTVSERLHVLFYKGRLVTMLIKAAALHTIISPPCWVIKSFWGPPSDSPSCGSSVTGKCSPKIHSYHFYGHSHLGFSFLRTLESRALKVVISSAFHLTLGGRPFLRSLHSCAAAGKHAVLIGPGCERQSRH